MAWVDLTALKEKVGAPWSTNQGSKGCRAPTASLPDTVGVPMHGYVGNESNCPFSYFQVQPPFGEHRHEPLNLTDKLDVASLNKLFGAIWLVGFIQNGIPADLVYNLGEGNNISQQQIYEIVSASGSRLTLKGKNPKRLTQQRGDFNPEYLAGEASTDPEDEDGIPARLLFTEYHLALPPGAMVEFLHPSVLRTKLTPYIVRVDYPTSNAENDVEFDVYLSANADECMEPEDAAFPPGDDKYYVRCLFHSTAPETWPHLQGTDEFETQFTPQLIAMDAAELAASGGVTDPAGTVELVNSSDGSTRALKNGMLRGTLNDGALLISWADDAGYHTMSPSDANSRLTVTQSPGPTWESKVDLSDLLLASGLIHVGIFYWAESVSGDDDRLPFAGNCANCRVDPTGSRDDDDGRYCAARDVADGFGDFEAGCWQPECSHFALGFEGAAYNSSALISPQPSDMRRSSNWAPIWTRASWILRQQLVGVAANANFKIERPAGGGASLGEVLGGFANDVPGGAFESKDLLFGATMGQRSVTSDGDSESSTYGDTQSLVPGAFVARSEDDMATSPPNGFFPASVSGWTTRPTFNNGSQGENTRIYPEFGIGGTTLHGGEWGESSMFTRSKLETGRQMYCTEINTALVEPSIVAMVEAITGS